MIRGLRRMQGIALLAWGLSACSLVFPQRSQHERLDALTSFTMALSKHDFHAAGAMLSPTDRMRMTDESGAILPQFRERLDALRLSTLMNNPLIAVEDGKVAGVFDVLPVVALGTAAPDTVGAVPADSASVSENLGPNSAADSSAAEQAELRKTAEAFFSSVRERKWQRALSYLDPQESQDFVNAKGRLTEASQERMERIDTSSWAALTLKDGKLTGVALLLPDSPR